MELARAIRALAKRPRLVAVGVLIAAAAALFSTYTLSGGKLRARSLQYSAASTQVIVDAERSVLGSVTQSFEPLSQRAWVYANFMTSPTFLDAVGQHVGLSGAQLYAAGPLTVNEPRIEQEPTELKRNVEITGETKPYRLSYEAQTGLPTITINSQAPKTDQAVALANSAAAGLQSYVARSELTDGIPRNSRIVIRQLVRRVVPWSMAASARHWHSWCSSECSFCGARSCSTRAGSARFGARAPHRRWSWTTSGAKWPTGARPPGPRPLHTAPMHCIPRPVGSTPSREGKTTVPPPRSQRRESGGEHSVRGIGTRTAFKKTV